MNDDISRNNLSNLVEQLARLDENYKALRTHLVARPAARQTRRGRICAHAGADSRRLGNPLSIYVGG